METLTFFASLLGALTFAFSGVLVGMRKKFDLMGLLVMAFLTAHGGGIIRDLLLAKRPDIFLSTAPFWISGLAVLIALLIKTKRALWLESHWLFVVMDAIGLVIFALTGALLALNAELHFFGVLTLAFLTAAGGGIIRDILVKEIPLILHRDFYGSIALIVASIVFCLHHFVIISPLSLLITFSIGLGLRLWAYRKGWHLPKA